MTTPTGVSFLVPVHNGEAHLDAVLRSILAQLDGRPHEVVVVEDRSRDRSREVLTAYAAAGTIRMIDGPGRGATAALNEGLRAVRYPIVCQVDQDVVLGPGWMRHLVGALERDPSIAAVQGYYETGRGATPWARVMGLDLEDRYRNLAGRAVDHVCTGNTAYRTEALHAVGRFDESLGYGYDNDISYRLVDAGYRLVIEPMARSHHHWRDGWWTYMVQQYGFGYGRLDLVNKHRRRVTGDDVSSWTMMLHAPLMAAALVMLLLALLARATPWSGTWPAVIAAGILAALALERAVAGVRAARAFHDMAGLLFVPMHLQRDVAWVAAITVWSWRCVRRAARRPSHSMQPRRASDGDRRSS